MDNERNDEEQFDDDDLFEGLSEEDYAPEPNVEADDDLDDSGYVHDTFDNEEELYNYQDEDEAGNSAYGMDPSTQSKGGGVLAQFKRKFKEGSLSDKLRALVIPIFVIVMVVGYCGYKIMELLGPSAPVVQQQETGLDVRQYIERPKPPSDELKQAHLNGSKPEALATAEKTVEITAKPNPTTAPKQAATTSTPPTAVVKTDQAAQQPTPQTPSAVPVSNPDEVDIHALMGVENEDSPDVIAKPAKHTVTKPVEKPVELTKPNLKQTESEKPMPSNPGQDSMATLQSTVEQLTKDRQIDQEKIASLTKQLTEANTHLSSLSQDLKSALDQLHTQIAALKKTHQEQQTVVALTKRAAQDYTVQAMIPGRAWLKDKQGKTITISRGQTLPGYGSVLKIDTDSGVIIMSSGAVLSYALGH